MAGTLSPRGIDGDQTIIFAESKSIFLQIEAKGIEEKKEWRLL